jgi:hypothetical protein
MCPQSKTKCFTKEYQSLLQGKNHINEKTTSTFMFHVMMLGGLVLEVVFASFTNFIFVVMT